MMHDNSQYQNIRSQFKNPPIRHGYAPLYVNGTTLTESQCCLKPLNLIQSPTNKKFEPKNKYYYLENELYVKNMLEMKKNRISKTILSNENIDEDNNKDFLMSKLYSHNKNISMGNGKYA